MEIIPCRVIYMLNNKNNTIKLIIATLSSMLVLLIIVFAALIFRSNTVTPTNVNPLLEWVYLNDDTELVVLEKCLHCPTEIVNEKLYLDIRSLNNPTQPTLKAFLKDYLSEQLGPNEDPIKLFTKDLVVVEYTVDKCDICSDDSIFVILEDKHLIFYQGHPANGEIIKELEEDVLFLDEQYKAQFTQGIKMEDLSLYIGIFRNNIAIFDREPVHGQPIFIFDNLSVSGDLVDIIKEEEPFNTYQRLLDLIEAYSGNY